MEREVAHVDPQRVRLHRRLETPQRLETKHADHQRRPLASLRLELERSPQLVRTIFEDVFEVDVAFAQLLLRALRRPPL